MKNDSWEFQGVLNKQIILDALKNFSLFMEVKKGEEVKIICRYQQYRAVGKIIERLRSGQTPLEKSGVVWHTQGSGKSLTMVFFIKKLRMADDLKDYKVIMMVDRRELEEQLSETSQQTGEKVNIVDSRRSLSKFKSDSSDLNMVMIHKFMTNTNVTAQSLIEAGIVPQFEKFETSRKEVLNG